MKKFYSFIFFLIITFNVIAENIAIVNFSAGEGVSTADVYAINRIFTSKLQTSTNNIDTKIIVDSTLNNLQIQQGDLTNSQITSIGEEQNISKIILGKVYTLFGTYNLEIMILNAKDASIFANEIISFTGQTVNEAVSNIVQNLIEKMIYVDLGLPSGTKWKSLNEGGNNALYTYNEATSKFGYKLPTQEQYVELKNQCTWTYTGSGYKVVGPNGNSIYFPLAGTRCKDNVDSKDTGFYWSSTPFDGMSSRILIFHSKAVAVDCWMRRCGCSVRLVQN